VSESPIRNMRAENEVTKKNSMSAEAGVAVARRAPRSWAELAYRNLIHWNELLSTCQGEHEQNGLGKLAIAQKRWGRNGRSVRR